MDTALIAGILLSERTMTLNYNPRILQIRNQIEYLCKQHGYCLNLWPVLAQERYYQLSYELKGLEQDDLRTNQKSRRVIEEN